MKHSFYFCTYFSSIFVIQILLLDTGDGVPEMWKQRRKFVQERSKNGVFRNIARLGRLFVKRKRKSEEYELGGPVHNRIDQAQIPRRADANSHHLEGARDLPYGWI